MQPYHRQALKRFEDAAVDLAFKGAQHPDDWPAIEKEYELAKATMIRILDLIPADAKLGRPRLVSSEK